MSAPVRGRAKSGSHRLSDAEYEALLEAQGGHCALCPATPKTRRLHTDRDHRTGLVRGLLCHRCNRNLPAWVTVPWLVRAQDYLTSASRMTVPKAVTRQPSNYLKAETELAAVRADLAEAQRRADELAQEAEHPFDRSEFDALNTRAVAAEAALAELKREGLHDLTETARKLAETTEALRRGRSELWALIEHDYEDDIEGDWVRERAIYIQDQVLGAALAAVSERDEQGAQT